MTVTAKCTPKYLISVNALAKFLQIGLGIVVSILASTHLCFKNYFTSGNEFCQSVFDSNSDVKGHAFVVVASAVMAGATFLMLLFRLFDVNNVDYDTNWRSVELFFNGIGFAVFAFFGALETWYACGYYAGTDYISPLNVKTFWIAAAACAFANSLLHLLIMLVAGLTRPKN